MPSTRLSTPHHLRFLAAHAHLSHVFGGDWFAKGAESFARFFGTPFFLMAQSAIVICWIYLNAAKEPLGNELQKSTQSCNLLEMNNHSAFEAGLA